MQRLKLFRIDSGGRGNGAEIGCEGYAENTLNARLEKQIAKVIAKAAKG